MDWTFLIKTGISLLAILNPLGAIPLFLGLTEGMDSSGRRRTGRSASLAVATVLVVAVWFGEDILEVFGVRIASFQIGGGVLALLMAIDMLQARLSPAKQTREEAREAGSRESVGVVPLGIPLLAGPGSISLAIVGAEQAPGMSETIGLTVAVVLLGLVTWAVLRAAEPIGRVLGRTGINIITRLMGLVLAAIAIEFIATGMASLFPGLLG
ncbi:MAG TPA: YchE family NAAT transporter [Gemmatimonadota bacterium]|nr:YchE family NAAT transporter [Gemmatimonadota bacterium]